MTVDKIVKFLVDNPNIDQQIINISNVSDLTEDKVVVSELLTNDKLIDSRYLYYSDSQNFEYYCDKL